jgi:hypothetical protein
MRVNRRKRRRRRRMGWVMVLAAGLVVIGGIWLIVTGLMARSALAHARADVLTLRREISAGDLSAARATTVDFAERTSRAHRLTTGPAWAIAATVPLGGRPLQTIRGITAGMDLVASDALPQLVHASSGLDPEQLRGTSGGVDVGRLAAAVPALDFASATLSSTASHLGSLPHNTWLPSIDAARRDVAVQLGALSAQVASVDTAAHIAPTMLGATGPKRYFVAFQNDAEARGTGGLPGAFAIMQVDHGALRFLSFESDAALDGVSADVKFGAAYDQLYDGADTTTDYRNSNLSPNFPYAAQIWVSMWQEHTGQHLDGAIALDPTALSYLLAVTGPASLPDHTVVSASNVVSLTQSQIYERFATDNAGRRAALLAVARAVGTEVIDSRADSTALIRAAGRAAAQRRLLMWSSDPTIEKRLEPTPLSGDVPATTAAYAGLSVVNDGGDKLDYYLDRRLVWQRIGCGPRREVLVTITLTNTAPARGLPRYVTSRSDTHMYAVQPGDDRLEVSYLATQGALMRAVTVDGVPATAAIGSEHQHPVYTVDLELPLGTTRTIVLRLSEPDASGPPEVLRQPLVRPLAVSVADAGCS